MITAPLIFNITYVRFISSLWERLWMVHILYAVPLTTTSPVMRGRVVEPDAKRMPPLFCSSKQYPTV